MKTLLHIIFAITALVGCGIHLDDPKSQETAQTTEQIEEKEETLVYSEPQPVYLKGSVSAGFNITVDGQTYEDSEDFYTKQIDALEAEKDANGYADYSLTFDARLGLTDLKDGMTVQAEGIGEEGYAGETIVVNDGTFEIRFPPEADGETLNIRANKRIGVILRNGNETIYWCYNFLANKETEIGLDKKPIILRHFKTRLTKYKCAGRQANPLSIPKNASNVVIADKPSQPAQIESWNDQWQEEVVDNNDQPITQAQIDAWNQEWNDKVVGNNNSDNAN